MTTFPPLSKFPGMFFHASCYNCGHADFVHFSKLVREGYRDVRHSKAMKPLSCSQCESKKLSVTLHGAGVRAAAPSASVRFAPVIRLVCCYKSN